MRNLRRLRNRRGNAPLIAVALTAAMLSACAEQSDSPIGAGQSGASATAPNNGGNAQSSTTASSDGGDSGTDSADATGGTKSSKTSGQASSNGGSSSSGSGTSSKATGSNVDGTGGAKPTSSSSKGGSMPNTKTATGGQKSTGAGGTSSSSTSQSTPVTNPDAAAAVSACIDKMPWGQNNIKDRDKLIDVIIKTCVEFAPPGDGWQTYCQMFLVGAIVTESSFNADSVVQDSYGGSTDPTVGLTQVRYSSTVKDFARKGNKAALERIGCTLIGTAGANDTGAQHLDLMKDVACNVGLGAWYYFLYATGNGGSQVVYLDQYCSGSGVGATLVTGMLSHQKGPSGAIGAAQNDYTNNIRKYFNSCLTVSGTHPFDMKLQPSISQYCG